MQELVTKLHNLRKFITATAAQNKLYDKEQLYSLVCIEYEKLGIEYKFPAFLDLFIREAVLKFLIDIFAQKN